LESGEVRLLLATGASQKQLLEVATPGTMLGLSESMSGEKYRATPKPATRPRQFSYRAKSFWHSCVSTAISVCRSCGC